MSLDSTNSKTSLDCRETGGRKVSITILSKYLEIPIEIEDRFNNLGITEADGSGGD